ncbi:MAG: hypothetical protein C5B50_18480 [Verrucomicrobia bacterium]|nr:MAG: hypothetical protein C5B50_18480 [Verrucomicrobiota bacterium]
MSALRQKSVSNPPRLRHLTGVIFGKRKATVLMRFPAICRVGAILGLFVLCCPAVHAAHTQVRLLLASEAAKPGDTVLAAVDLKMDPEWHTYWKNPGASGMSTKIEWQLPKGVTAGQIQWPVPEKLTEKVTGEDFTTYIYTNETMLVVPLTLAPDLPAGPLEIKAKVSWLECKLECIKADGEVKATLTVGQETRPSVAASLIKEWQKKLPQTTGAPTARAWWEKAASGDTRPLIIEWTPNQAGAFDVKLTILPGPPKDASAASVVINQGAIADFYPDPVPEAPPSLALGTDLSSPSVGSGADPYEVQGATESLSSPSGKVVLRKQVKKYSGEWPREVTGVLIERTANQSASAGSEPLWKMLLFAFIGGLILNVMPCVLPVIALKILGFVNQSKEHPGRVRVLGLVYVLGVLVSFLILGAIVIGLRAAGSSVGLGFQLANPYFVVAMSCLTTLIALNLFGVFEVGVGGRAVGAAAELSSRHGTAGAFFNGFFATVLATSCSAPILAQAIGFAFDKDPAIILLIMATVGIGLAAPYLVLSWQPSWLRFLPKPGLWMDKFKVAMGFPMLGWALWLCSLLVIHYGERWWWMTIFLVFIGVAAWIYGEFVQRGQKLRWLGWLVSALVLAIGYVYAIDRGLQPGQPLVQSSLAAERPSESPKGITWQDWSSEAVAAARADGHPVVVDFTAKWCLTCNTVIKPTFENDAVQKKMKDLGVVALLANYTLQPPAITAELRRYGRAAVPFVLVYPRDTNAPPMAFDWISPSTISNALDKAAQN